MLKEKECTEKSFEITMSGISEDNDYKTIESDGSVIQKKVLHRGVWGSKPSENAIVKIEVTDVNITGATLASIQESASVSQLLNSSFSGFLKIGDVDTVIDRSLEFCVRTMLIKEKSRFVIKFPSLTNCLQECSTYPYVLECSIEMFDIVTDEPLCDWSNDKIYGVSLHHKTEGVKLFNNGRKIESFLRFRKSYKLLNILLLNVEEGNDPSEYIPLKVALLNNMAKCQLEFQNYVHAITLCCKVLSHDPNNLKSLYRRAIAYINVQKFDEAKCDLQKILDFEPSNTKVKEKLTELKILTREKDANYAAIVKKMFSS